MTWVELFSGYSKIKAITFSSGISFVYKLLDMFDDAEMIFGCEDVMSNTVQEIMAYQAKLMDKIRRTKDKCKSNFLDKHLSQNERSLLSAFQESAKRYAEADAGILVPFDSFYQTIEQFIDYDIKTVFSNAEKRTSIDEFSIRVLRVLFMIKYVKEMPATINRLATLLVGNINEDKAVLKERILEALKNLEAETLIQKNGDEYDFLTNAEQDVNRQINSTGYNEGEVQRNILDIIYDRVLESNKLRYENRYDFGLNRFVDSESKGSFNQDYITIRVYTVYSNISDAITFQAESAKGSVVVDLTEGLFIDELIRANKIATFKRNNSATMSASLAEIMSKKTAEYSERMKRAEDIIKQSLRTAPIYFNGQVLDIKPKDGRDRLTDALKEMVKQDYYKLGLVSYFYNDQKAVSEVLDNKLSDIYGDDLSQDANYGAYSEIFERIKNDKMVGRTVTVKKLIDAFSKKPYGWRDFDILGMIATLWKHNKLQISIHEVVVDDNNRSFKIDFARKNGLDTMVVKMQEKIDDAILYQVKRIMQEAFDENIPLDELKLKEGVLSFFKHKRDFLSGLKAKYGSDYAGCKVVPELYKHFDSICRSTDAATIFAEIIARKDALYDNAEILEQLEVFYKDGSNQQKTYKDACIILDWYRNNYMFNDLTKLQDVIEAMSEIVEMEMPFSKMSQLANLVFQAGEIREAILEEKYQATKRCLEADLSTINKELEEALGTNLNDEQKAQISNKGKEIADQYETWLKALNKNTSNMDQYITSSQTTVQKFRAFIGMVMSQSPSSTPVRRSKKVRIIECVPVANKKIASATDIDKVLNAIRDKLLAELKENDEINLD